MNIPTTTMERFAAATAAAAFLAGVCLCFLLPDRAWAWLVAMFAMPTAWLLIRNYARSRPEFRVSTLVPAITGAGLMLTVAMLAVIAEQLSLLEAQPGELPDRAWGLIMGSLIAVYANVVPKQATSVARARVLRFCAWALVLGGLGYALASLLAPQAYANIVATTILGSAMALVVTRLLWGCRHRDETASSAGN